MTRSFSTTDLNKNLGDVLDAAAREPVSITRHGKARFVIASADYFTRLQGIADARASYRTKNIPEDLRNALLRSNADLIETE